MGTSGVHGAQRPKSRPMGVRASVVAVKRVMTVERRDAGRWKDDRRNTGQTKPARVPARANQRWNTPSAYDLARTEGLAGILGDEREMPLLPLAREPTDWKAGCGKSARPVWREGWRTAPSLPLSNLNYALVHLTCRRVRNRLCACARAGLISFRTNV